jgi:hypothetical protein
MQGIGLEKRNGKRERKKGHWNANAMMGNATRINPGAGDLYTGLERFGRVIDQGMKRGEVHLRQAAW